MKILLIAPSNERATLITRFHIPPLSLGIIAGLTPPDWEVKIVQEPIDTVDLEEEVDLVGITAATHNARRAYALAEEFRKRGRAVILGGIHPTVLPHEALRHCDSVCRGEAEPVWADVLDDFRRRRLRAVYQHPSSFDLSRYVSPDRERMPNRRTLFFDAGTVETSRGCPQNCDFCSVSSAFGRKLRFRSLENLLPEIERVENRLLFFVDDNIVSRHARARKLFTEMAPLGKRWIGQATISIAGDPKLVESAAASGCVGLLIGLESVTADGMARYGKNLKTIRELREALRTIKDSGIGVLATLIFGADSDTRETMRESLATLAALDLTAASLGILVPYPGTLVAQRLELEGRIMTRNWDCYDINTLVFRPRHFSCEDFIEQMHDLRREYFSLRSVASRVLRYAGVSIPLALGFNLAMRAHNRRCKATFSTGGEDDDHAQAGPHQSR
jgi:radical SAM superfamily enzyme YgiQ (UPF0313 family)